MHLCGFYDIIASRGRYRYAYNNYCDICHNHSWINNGAGSF